MAEQGKVNNEEQILEGLEESTIIDYVRNTLDKKVFDDQIEIVEYVEDSLGRLVFVFEGDVVNYVKQDLNKIVFDNDDDVWEYAKSKVWVMEENTFEPDTDDHPRNYIDTPDELREHLITILGMGHYVTNADIINKIHNILN